MLDRDSLLERAEFLRQQKRYKDAEQQVGIVLRDNPEDVTALMILGHCKIDTKQTEEGIRILHECLKYEADNHYILYLIAFAYYQDNKEMSATQYLDAAIAIFPYEAGYFSLKAHLHLDKKEYQQALDAANEGLAVDAEDISCLNARSTALFRLKRKDEAYETINEALELDPEDYSTHANYGWHYLEKGKYKDATKHFRESLRINPNYLYAREGYKAALKSRMPFYRWLLQYSIWMSRQDRGVRIAVIFGIWILIRLIDYVSKDSPLRYLAAVLVGAYFLMVVMSWLGDAFANLYLLFTPHGRYILNVSERWSATLVGIAVGLGIVFAVAGLTVNPAFYLLAGITASLAIPSNELEFPIRIFKGAGRAITAQIMLLLGLAACITMFINDEVASFFAIIYGVFFLGFMWSNSIKAVR